MPPWYDALTKNIPAIQEKVLELMAQNHGDTREYFGTSLVEKGKWESKAFLVWNVWRKPAGGGSKEVCEYFQNIDGLVSLSISVIKPGTHIKPHNGDTDAVYRIHIPVLIPTGLPECGIKVGGIDKAWDEHEPIAFCDAHVHEAWNYSDETRVILIADIVKEEFLPQTRSICAKVSSWLLVQKALSQKILRALPMILKIPVGYSILLGARPFFLLLQKSRK